jgi:hypothetical protein
MNRLRTQIEDSLPWNPVLVWEAMEELFPKVEFLSFEGAREFVRKLKLKHRVEWFKYRKSGKKPKNIPSGPDITYKGKGWNGWGDFLGTGTIAPQDRIFLSLEEAREFVRKLKLKGVKEWREYSKLWKESNNIPFNPYWTYRDKGWISWGDFLGTAK